MKSTKTLCLLSLLVLASILGACNRPGSLLPFDLSLPSAAEPGNPASPADSSLATPLPPPAETLISFRVLAPANTPPGGLVYLTVLDEVTGLPLNADAIPMEPLPQTIEGAPSAYVLTLPFPIGSVVTYRYERDLGGVRVAEHLPDGSAVRYRSYVVSGQNMVEDVISRWTDTPFTGDTGRIQGQALETNTGTPLPGLLVEAGGMQTSTTSDGSFVLDGLPEGTHNLVVVAPDGAHLPFQQGARVASQSTTPAEVHLASATLVKVVFVVRAPEETPPLVPIRMAGTLQQLGNSYADLEGGMSVVPDRMPVLQALPDGRYTITLSLPAGLEVRYKYTLGNGYWNAEHSADGATRLRSLIVPNHTVLIEDSIETWYAGNKNTVTFDLNVPKNTPSEDWISIQFNPLIGWGEPLPMWNLGNDRWAYILFSPLNLPGEITYRYCRSTLCGRADDAKTPGKLGEGRTHPWDDRPQTIQDTIDAWQDWGAAAAELPVVEATDRGTDFAVGVELARQGHPAIQILSSTAITGVYNLGAEWAILTPTWTYGRTAPGHTPPVLAPLPGRDMLWADSLANIQKLRQDGLKVGLYPTPNFQAPVDEWWLGAPRADPGWWPVWFDQYRKFALHHADLATMADANALIIGGDWLSPALPGGLLPGGQPSDVPADAERQWRDLIGEVRSRFGGSLLWAISSQSIHTPPPFLDAVDQIYLTISIPPGQNFETWLGADLATWLDNTALPAQLAAQKPLVLAVELSPSPDLQSQVNLYQIALQEAAGRAWISGFISRSYDPSIRLQDNNPSVNGKPAADLLRRWFIQLRQ